jgi:hypothetical protein
MSDRHDTLPEEFYLSDFEEFFVGVDRTNIPWARTATRSSSPSPKLTVRRFQAT